MNPLTLQNLNLPPQWQRRLKIAGRFLWHGGILVMRIGWILAGVLAAFFVCLDGGAGNKKRYGGLNQPDAGEIDHPDWNKYYENMNKF
jgi:hypothetical protein